ncbi:homing endonuclease associated repeat-containing protein, partial [Clostridium botulinum]
MTKKISDKDLLNNLKEVYNTYGYITKNTINKYGVYKDHLYYRRFKTLDNAMELINIDVKKNYKIKNQKYSKGRNKKYSKENLLNILTDYYNNVGFPVQRNFKESNGLPSYTTYYNEFGSFKNAILISGIKIPKQRKHYFNREKLSDKEMLDLLKYHTDKKLEKYITLLTNDDIDAIPNMPHSGTYCIRFGGIVEAYKNIGIDYKEFNKNAIKKDMTSKYIELCNKFKCTLDSRDLDKLSKKNLCYSASTYIEYFGNISDLQKYCGFLPTMLGKHMSKEDVIKNLYKLYDEIGDVPAQKDIDSCEYLPNTNCIAKHFGSIREMQKQLFGQTYSKVKITNKGTICNSSYEYTIAKMLENYNVQFVKEELYKNYIKNFDKRYKFDFTIIINNEKY